MESTDGETPGGDGLASPASRDKNKIGGKVPVAKGDSLPTIQATPEQLAATQRFLQTLFKSVTAAIMVFLAGNLAASEIFHCFTHNPDGSHKTTPVQNTNRRGDRGVNRVKIQQVKDDDIPASGPPPVPCEAVGVGCLNRVASGFCHLRQHLCMVAPHPDFIMELHQKMDRQSVPHGPWAEIMPELRVQHDFLDRLVSGQEKILVQLPLLAEAAAAQPVTDNEAHRLFALLRTLELESNFRKAPVTRVFMLYCLDGKSRDAVARACKCSPALVTLRLQAIEQKLGRKPAELRQFSDHFERIADSLSDSRARRIDRRRAIDGDDPDDEV
jgi:hypothetical protein